MVKLVFFAPYPNILPVIQRVIGERPESRDIQYRVVQDYYNNKLEHVEADVIIAPSITGFTTQMLSKWRPGARIIGMSPSMATVRQMRLQWGVVPVWSRRAESTDELIESSVEELKNRGFVTVGELAVITAGVVTYARRHEAATQTNIMRVINIE